jgi:hypothetical protein
MESELLTAIFQLQKEATKIALAESGIISPVICQAEAYRTYKRRWVEKMEAKGLLSPCNKITKKGEKKEFRRIDLVRLKINEAGQLGVGNVAHREKRHKRLSLSG